MIVRCSVFLLFLALTVSAQENPRVFGILPNYKTVPDASSEAAPLTTKGKFGLATRDSFDWSTLLVSGFFAGVSQVSNTNADYGHGGKGFAKRYAAAYGDQVIGNYLSEAIYPTLFHQDPRYYRAGKGSGWRRVGYAISRVAVTRSDDGRAQFNYSEFAGNFTAAAIASAYYPASQRTASDVLQKGAFQVGTDAGFNVLKEFWPDIYRKFLKK